jgi:putative transposase
MNADRPMYRWRRMTPEQRQEALEYRQRHRLPWHGPPHYQDESEVYLITAACYEHKPVIGLTAERMAGFEAALLQDSGSVCQQIFAWIVLPNHYHLLVHAPEIKSLLAVLGKLHGRTSHQWNGKRIAGAGKSGIAPPRPP